MFYEYYKYKIEDAETVEDLEILELEINYSYEKLTDREINRLIRTIEAKMNNY